MKKNYILALIVCFLFSGSLLAQPVTQVFNASGTYTVPVGYTAIVTIEAWGAGGSGGGGNSGNNDRSGGGGGAYAQVSTYTLTAGTYTVTVGTGGVASTANNGAGQAGGSSSFTTVVIAAGGGAGSSANGAITNGGAAASSTGTVKFSGGNGGARSNSNAGGGGGGSATSSAVGSNGTAGSGSTAGTGGAGSGTGGNGGTTNAVGANGVAPGAGGGGKGNNGANSGSGAAGRVRVAVLSFGALPITVNYFNGANTNGVNILSWSADCTSPSVTFEVERSFDGANFTSISMLPATMQRCLTPFNFTDNNKVSGIAYYRIKIIDYNGKISYTSVVKISSQVADMKLTGVFPNPVVNTASFNFTASKKDNIQLSIINFEGRIMQSRNVTIQQGSSNVSVDVTSMPKGTYLVKAVYSDGQSTVVKFVKQ